MMEATHDDLLPSILTARRTTMPTRTLPTRDVTLADGRRLYYNADESRRTMSSGQAGSVYLTKRGPAGVLRVLVTIDQEPERGEHYHLSASYPEHTPTPDEVLAVAAALLPGGGHFGAMTPETNKHSLHGHVVHLIEDTPVFLAAHPDAQAAEGKPAALYIRTPAPEEESAPEDTATALDRRLRLFREELGLVPPFTSRDYRTALDRRRARRGLTPGALPVATCTEQRTGADGRPSFVVPVPAGPLSIEQEHATFHGMAHILRRHQQLATGLYTAEQEREAEALADALMTYSVCGDPDDRST